MKGGQIHPVATSLCRKDARTTSGSSYAVDAAWGTTGDTGPDNSRGSQADRIRPSQARRSGAGPYAPRSGPGGSWNGWHGEAMSTAPRLAGWRRPARSL